MKEKREMNNKKVTPSAGSGEVEKQHGQSDRHPEQTRKYEGSGTVYTSKSGTQYKYNKESMEKTNAWIRANKDHYTMALNAGLKAVITAALPDPANEKLGSYLLRLAEEDILKRVTDGELDAGQLISVYYDDRGKHKENLSITDPDNPYLERSFSVDRTDDFISRLQIAKAVW